MASGHGRRYSNEACSVRFGRLATNATKRPISACGYKRRFDGAGFMSGASKKADAGVSGLTQPIVLQLEIPRISVPIFF